VVGKAGAGKTFALHAARDAWQASGVRVIGCALAARAAAELHAGAGIDSYTIDALLAALDRPGPAGGLAHSSVLVVDEAGMVGTRKLARLLDHTERGGAKLVLVGDHHQLPEIDVGGMFRGLVNRLPVVELTDNRRQRQAWERDALDELRGGDPAAAVAVYNGAGRVVVGDTAEAVREQLVSDWWTARTEHDGPGDRGVMIAARVNDVEDLNDRARVRLAAAGELTGPALPAAAGREFQAGDRIVCLRNDRRLGVVNGTRARVTTAEPCRGDADCTARTRRPNIRAPARLPRRRSRCPRLRDHRPQGPGAHDRPGVGARLGRHLPRVGLRGHVPRPRQQPPLHRHRRRQRRRRAARPRPPAGRRRHRRAGPGVAAQPPSAPRDGRS